MIIIHYLCFVTLLGVLLANQYSTQLVLGGALMGQKTNAIGISNLIEQNATLYWPGYHFLNAVFSVTSADISLESAVWLQCIDTPKHPTSEVKGNPEVLEAGVAYQFLMPIHRTTGGTNLALAVNCPNTPSERHEFSSVGKYCLIYLCSIP